MSNQTYKFFSYSKHQKGNQKYFLILFLKSKKSYTFKPNFLLRGIWNTDKYSVAHMCMEIPYRVLQYLSHLKLDFANQLLDLAIDVLVSK